MRVTKGAQRCGEASGRDTSLWSHQLTARAIPRNNQRNIGARKHEVSAGHRAEFMEHEQVYFVDEFLAQRKFEFNG